MNKTKKIIIGIVLGFILLVGLSFGGFTFYKLNKVLTIITIDINPSFKLSLNYKNEVLKAEGLNDDGKKLLKEENFKGDDLEDAIEEIAELVIEKGYITEEDNHILINVDGRDIKETAVTLINKEFKEEDVECNVIIQDINAEAKENAEKYGISESKASYIEEIIKENKDITFEELKDKSINEINKHVETKKEQQEEESKKQQEEQKKEENKQNTTTNNKNNNSNNSNNNNNSSSNKKPSASSYVCPSSPANTNNVWCEYGELLKDNHFAQTVNCPMNEKKDDETLRQMALKHLGLQSVEARGQYSHPIKESRASYCSARKFIITTTETRTTLIMDSATGTVLEESKETVPTPKVSEEEAIDIFLKHFNLSRENLAGSSAWWCTDNEGANFVYRYSVHIRMNDDTQHAGSVNALTGELYSVAY